MSSQSLWVLVFSLFFCCQVAWAEDKEFEGEGKARIFAGNVDGARSEAMTAALKDVIRAASRDVLGEALFAEKEKEVSKRVYAVAKKYLNWHGVLSENATSTELVIRVKGSVSLDKLRSDLSSLLPKAPAATATSTTRRVLLFVQEFSTPDTKQLEAELSTTWGELGYEVVFTKGPLAEATLQAAMKKASASLAAKPIVQRREGVVDSPVVASACVRVESQLQLLGSDAKPLTIVSGASLSCQSLAADASQIALSASFVALRDALRKEKLLASSAPSKKRLWVAGLPSFAAVEELGKLLKDTTGKSCELLALEEDKALFALPLSAPSDVAERLQASLTSYRSKISTLGGVSQLTLESIQVELTGVADAKTLFLLTEQLRTYREVTQLAAPAAPTVENTATLRIWSQENASSLAALFSGMTLLGRSVSVTASKAGVLKMVLGPSRLGATP